MKDSSTNVKDSILLALQEEKESGLTRTIKIAKFLSAVSIPVVGLLWFSFRGELNLFWLVALVVWLGIAIFAAVSYWKPQPRIEVPGFWTSWMYAKLLTLFLLISAIQLLICPHLAMIEPSPYFSVTIFETLQTAFMTWGGMAACMFFCGLSFSALATLAALLLMRRATKGSRSPVLFKIAGLAILAQLPIVILQISDPHLRSYFLLWLLGSFIGVLSIASLLSILFKKVSSALSQI